MLPDCSVGGMDKSPIYGEIATTTTTTGERARPIRVQSCYSSEYERDRSGFPSLPSFLINWFEIQYWICTYTGGLEWSGIGIGALWCTRWIDPSFRFIAVSTVARVIVCVRVRETNKGSQMAYDVLSCTVLYCSVRLCVCACVWCVVAREILDLEMVMIFFP